MVVYHGTHLGRAGEILLTGQLSGEAPPIYPSTTRGFVYVTFDLDHAMQYARNAYEIESLNRRTVLLGNLLVVFRLLAEPDALLPDADEQAVDAELTRETGCPFHRAEVSRRLRSPVWLAGQSVAFINPTHSRARHLRPDEVPWRRIPEYWHDGEPLFW